MTFRSLKIACVSLGLALVLTACGGVADFVPDESPPPPPPELALLVNPPVPLTDDEPLRRLEAELLRRTGLVTEVIAFDRSADMLVRLCENTSDLPTTAWLNGLTFAVSQARDCGQPAFAVQRTARTMNELDALYAAYLLESPPINETSEPDEESADEPAGETVDTPEEAEEGTESGDSDAETPADEEVNSEPTAEPASETPADEDAATPVPTATPAPRATPAPSEPLLVGASAQVIIAPELGTTELSAIFGRVFCRTGYDDVYGWLLPLIQFRSAGINLERDARVIADVPDLQTLVRAVADGQCSMASVEPGDFAALGTLTNQVRRGANTGEVLPFGVLVYPLDIQLGVRLALNDAFREMADDPDFASQVLFPLLGQDALVTVTPETFDRLNTFLAESGIDLGALGE